MARIDSESDTDSSGLSPPPRPGGGQVFFAPVTETDMVKANRNLNVVPSKRNIGPTNSTTPLSGLSPQNSLEYNPRKKAKHPPRPPGFGRYDSGSDISTDNDSDAESVSAARPGGGSIFFAPVTETDLEQSRNNLPVMAMSSNNIMTANLLSTAQNHTATPNDAPLRSAANDNIDTDDSSDESSPIDNNGDMQGGQNRPGGHVFFFAPVTETDVRHSRTKLPHIPSQHSTDDVMKGISSAGKGEASAQMEGVTENESKEGSDDSDMDGWEIADDYEDAIDDDPMPFHDTEDTKISAKRPQVNPKSTSEMPTSMTKSKVPLPAVAQSTQPKSKSKPSQRVTNNPLPPISSTIDSNMSSYGPQPSYKKPKHGPHGTVSAQPRTLHTGVISNMSVSKPIPAIKKSKSATDVTHGGIAAAFGETDQKFYGEQPNLDRSGVSVLSAPQEFHRKMKWDIVYLTSSPLVRKTLKGFSPLEQLNIKEERDTFFSTLNQSGKALSVRHMQATTSNIIQAVTGGCRCIHYSGHGLPDSLVFEDPKKIGESHSVHFNVIRKLCEDADRRPEFVFASACHSEVVGQAFIQAGIKHVIAVKTQFELTDEAAEEFTKHFYNSLLNGYTIKKAFDTARNAVSAMSVAARMDEKKFILLPIDGDHNDLLFTDLPPGNMEDETTSLPPNNLPPPIPMFMGRAVDMCKIIGNIKDNGVRLVVLTGVEGVGKSATALMIAKYLCDRRIFDGGVFFVDTPKLRNEGCSSLRSMLVAAFRQSNVSSKLCDSQQTDTELFNKVLHHTGKLLLVFDGIDNYVDDSSHYGPELSQASSIVEAQKAIKTFLQKVFHVTRLETKVLVTCTNKMHVFSDIPGCMSRYYTLKELKDKDGAKLFSRLANQFRHTDVLQHRKLMSRLENKPSKIEAIAKLKHEFECNTLDDVLKAWETKLKINAHPRAKNMLQRDAKRQEKRKKRNELFEQNVKNPNARRLWAQARGMETVYYYEIFPFFKEEFRESTLSNRQLQQNDLKEAFINCGMNDDLKMHIKEFDKLYAWFTGICRLVLVLSDVWNHSNPIKIHGFLSRAEAIRRLEKAHVGTFLIRFSFSVNHSIAISFRDRDDKKQRVQHLAAKLLMNAKTETPIFRWSGIQQPMSLAQFIRVYVKLKYLYDETRAIPKEEIVFE